MMVNQNRSHSKRGAINKKRGNKQWNYWIFKLIKRIFNE